MSTAAGRRIRCRVLEGTVVIVIEWNGAEQIAVAWDDVQQRGLTVPPDSFIVVRS